MICASAESIRLPHRLPGWCIMKSNQASVRDTLWHYYNSTKGLFQPPYAPGCWKPVELLPHHCKTHRSRHWPITSLGRIVTIGCLDGLDLTHVARQCTINSSMQNCQNEVSRWFGLESLPESQRLKESGKPWNLTKYRYPQPQGLWSNIDSTKNSELSETLTARWGNFLSSLGMKGLIKWIWNVGKVVGWLGKSKVTVEALGCVSMTT